MDIELLELIKKVFIEGKDYISHICKYSYRLPLEYSGDMNPGDPHQDMLLHCRQSLESLTIVTDEDDYASIFTSKL